MEPYLWLHAKSCVGILERLSLHNELIGEPHKESMVKFSQGLEVL